MQVRADIKSNKGVIDFDVDNDQLKEMRLSSSGLSIGTTESSANLMVSGNAIVNELSLGGENDSSSNLHINGSISMSYQSLSSDTLIDNTSLIFVDTSSDNVVLTLPYAANVSGRLLTIKKTSLENTLWVKANGNTIDDYTTLEANAGDSYVSFQVYSNGGQWYLVGSNGFSGNRILDENLYTWFDFNGSGTTVTDQSGTGFNGSLVSPGGNTFGNDEGIAGAGLYLNGQDEYVQVSAGDASDYDLQGNNFSVSIWFKALSMGRIFHVGSDSFTSDHFSALIESGGNLTFSWTPGGTSNDKYTITGNYIDGEWHHLVGLRNGARTGQLWVDGVLEIDDTDSSGSLSGIDITTDFYIGRSAGGADYWEGYVDEFRFFDYALNESEIQLLFFPQ